MALGGGGFSAQNKVIPGFYINFASSAMNSTSASAGGTVAMPIDINWGEQNKMISVTNEEFKKNSLKLFGYSYEAPEMMPFREVFRNARTVYAYRLRSGGSAASNSIATAKYVGSRGNNLKTSITKTPDNESEFTVNTYLDSILVDSQTVKQSAELLDNDFVIFKSRESLSLAADAGEAFTGGNDDDAVTGEMYQSFYEKAESYRFNALACPAQDDTVKSMFYNWTKAMRDEKGIKFKTIVYNYDSADYEGVINIVNKAIGENIPVSALVYWVAGAEAGCALNASNTNKVYDGELTVDTSYTQNQLAENIENGKFTLHEVNETVRILDDITSFVHTTSEKGEDFKSCQTVRVIDRIANDIANLFVSRYMGVIPNDAVGRISLWSDICSYMQNLETMSVIENFSTDSVSVSEGNNKKSVVCSMNGISIINTMAILYMNVVIQ